MDSTINFSISSQTCHRHLQTPTVSFPDESNFLNLFFKFLFKNYATLMKIPAAFLPCTPYKKKYSLSSLEVPKVTISKQIAEGSFYKICLTTKSTVLRISKCQMASTDEIKILKCLNHPFINRMIKWWIEDSFLYFEMEKCDFSLKDREKKIEKFFKKNYKAETKGIKFKKIQREEKLNRIGNESINEDRKRCKLNFEVLNKNERESEEVNTCFVNCKNSSEIFMKKNFVPCDCDSISQKFSETATAFVPENPTIIRPTIRRLRKDFKPVNSSTKKNLLGSDSVPNSFIEFPIPTKRCLSLPNLQSSVINLSLEEIDGCLDGELLCDGSKLVPLTSLFPTSELFPTESVGSIFDPFSESLVSCNTSIVLNESPIVNSFIEPNIEILNVPQWINIMMYQISTALTYIHSKNIIHMDVKPENILIKIEGSEISFLLCDFNISKFGEGRFDLDGDKMYLAPEILNNRCYFKSDVYALGLIYLELNGMCELPCGGEKYSELRRNDFKDWRVDEITRRMLEMDPDKRCSAQDVSDYFLNILSG